MSNFRGTRGKWYMHPHAFMCVTSDSMSIANCAVKTSNVNTDELIAEQKANALLISKAPEMLEMLEKIIQGYSKAPGEMWIPDYIGNHIEDAKKLIKSATEL